VELDGRVPGSPGRLAAGHEHRHAGSARRHPRDGPGVGEPARHGRRGGADAADPRAALDEGCVGLSTGLIYPPGMYADRPELVALCRVAAESGGFFVVHMRNEGDHVLESIREVADICIEAGCPLHISHLKVAGRANWGKAGDVIGLIETYRRRGVGDHLRPVSLRGREHDAGRRDPPGFHSGGAAALLARLKDPDVREEIRRVQDRRRPSAGTTGSTSAAGTASGSMRSRRTRTGSPRGSPSRQSRRPPASAPVDVVCDLLVDEGGAVTMTVFYGCEEDVRTIMRSDCMTVCSDGIVGGKPHPRVYNTLRPVPGAIRPGRRRVAASAGHSAHDFPFPLSGWGCRTGGCSGRGWSPTSRCSIRAPSSIRGRTRSRTGTRSASRTSLSRAGSPRKTES